MKKKMIWILTNDYISIDSKNVFTIVDLHSVVNDGEDEHHKNG